MRLELDAVARAGGVKHRSNGALRDEARVELLKRASGGVAGVGKSFFTFCGKLGVERVEIFDGNISLAAHFEQRRWICHIQLQRNSAHGFEIHRDVVALRPVAACDAEYELAVPVMHADGHAVHLRLDDVFHFVAAKMFADRRIKRAEFIQRFFVLLPIAIVAVGFRFLGRMVADFDLFERKHRHEMFDAGKLFAGRAADALCGRFRRDESGEFFLQLLQFLVKQIVFAVGDELPALDVISTVVRADFLGELRVMFAGDLQIRVWHDAWFGCGEGVSLPTPVLCIVKGKWKVQRNLCWASRAAARKRSGC